MISEITIGEYDEFRTFRNLDLLVPNLTRSRRDLKKRLVKLTQEARFSETADLHRLYEYILKTFWCLHYMTCFLSRRVANEIFPQLMLII